MQLRRHQDIIAIKEGETSPAVAFHARNLQVAQVSDDVWSSMAPTTFSNGFVMQMERFETGVQPEAYKALNEWNVENDPDVKSRSFKSKIQSLTVNVTQLCNLHCSYCAAGGDGTYGDPVAKISVEKTLPRFEFFFNKLNPGDSFHVTFLGGEPLLYPEALRAIALQARIWAQEKKIELSMSLVTNGTLLTEKVLSLLEGLDLAVTISIDGTPEQHDRARPQKTGQGSALLAYSGLERLLNNKSLFSGIRIHGVFSRNNMQVFAAYQYFLPYAVDSFELTFDITESDLDLNNQFLSEMKAVAALAYERGGEKELRKIVLFDAYFRALDQQTRTENHCGSGKSLVSLDARNKLYACPLDVGQKNLELTENLHSIEESFIEKNDCQTCWARFLCGGGCLFAHRTLTGQKHKKHISYCERTRNLISLALLYYEKSRG